MNENLCPHMQPKETPKFKHCVDCDHKNGNDWAKRARIVRREFRRHHLTDRERLMAEVILDLTLGWGRESIAVPDRLAFREITGITESHVSEALNDLHQMRIIRVWKVNGVPNYCIREDPDPEGQTPFNWRAKARVPVRTLANSLNRIREFNGLPPLPAPLEAIGNFKVNLLAKKISDERPESVRPEVRTEECPVTEDLPHLF